MENIIPIIEDNKPFSPFYFYSSFIRRVGEFYLKNREEKAEFCLFEKNTGYYSIDPIAFPLLISLVEQLKKYHKSGPLKLYLTNTPSTIDALEFFFKTHFFYVVGNNTNPSFPIGANIFSFDERYLGGFHGKSFRADHKIRGYSLLEDNLQNMIVEIQTDEGKRDYLIEYFTFKVQEHFSDLLNDNEYTEILRNDFIKILSELITNGVLHSKSTVYALMFVDRYKTKFSISDNGIGLYESLKGKEISWSYNKFQLFDKLSQELTLRGTEKQKASLLAIFETLYFSMLKDRQGLFDLVCKVVLISDGYFRLHNDYAQIIISHRLYNELLPLVEIRREIINTHDSFLYEKIDDKTYNARLKALTEKSFDAIIDFSLKVSEKYNLDVKFSAIRFYQVRFKGVHIEVEIPNNSML